MPQHATICAKLGHQHGEDHQQMGCTRPQRGLSASGVILPVGVPAAMGIMH